MWTSPSPKALSWFGRALLAGALVGGAWWTTRTVREELKGDPLAAFRSIRPDALPEDVGIELKNVRLRRYVGKTVQAEMRVGDLAIARNRQVFHLKAIQDGVYRGPMPRWEAQPLRPAERAGALRSGKAGSQPLQGRVPSGKDIEVRFSAAQGEYNGFAGQVKLGGGVRASGAKFALATSDLTFDRRSATARLARGVKGTAYGAKVGVASLTYDLARGNFVAEHVAWEGKLPAEMFGQGSPEVTSRTWKILNPETNTIKANGPVITFRNPKLTDGEVIIVAPQATLNRQTDILVATGGIRYFSGRANLVADKVTIYHREKRAVFEGNVRMLVKPQSDEAKGPVEEAIPPFAPSPPEKVIAGKALPDPKEADRVRSGKSVRDYPLVMVAAKIDTIYAKGRRVANISGGSPQARQELGNGAWRQVWTTTARYDAENDLLRLESAAGKSDARMKNSLGDDLEADWFELSTKEDDDEYTGSNIRGSVISTEDDPRGTKGGGSGSTGGTTGGSTGGGSTGGTPRRTR